MGDVSKFIPISGNGENGENNIFGGIGNPNGTGATWEAGNVSTGETTNTTQNNVTSNLNPTETTWETGNVTTGGKSTTNSNITGNNWGIGNSNPTESTWKTGSTCTTGTTKNGNVTNNSNTGVNSEEQITSGFRVCGTSSNLPAKPSFWARLKNFFFYDPAEITPVQKAENVVKETTTSQESTWTKIVKWFLCEDESSKN